MNSFQAHGARRQRIERPDNPKGLAYRGGKFKVERHLEHHITRKTEKTGEDTQHNGDVCPQQLPQVATPPETEMSTREGQRRIVRSPVAAPRYDSARARGCRRQKRSSAVEQDRCCHSWHEHPNGIDFCARYGVYVGVYVGVHVR